MQILLTKYSCGLFIFFSKGTYLQIAYPGDVTEVSVKMYSYTAVTDFIKKLHVFKQK